MLNKRLKNLDGFIEFKNESEDLIAVWFQKKTQRFCLELNAKIILATKTFKPVENKLKELEATEIEVEEEENTCSFCDVECEEYFCSDECRIAELND